MLALVLQYCHVGHYNLKRSLCIPVTFNKVFILNAFFSRRMIPAFSGFRTNSSCFTAFMCQVVREYPSCIMENVLCKTMIAERGMQFMFFLQQLCEQDPILLVPVQLALSGFPFVIAGSVDPHDSAQKVYRIFYFEFFENFVVFPLPVTYSLFAPTPSTQYPFFNRAISTSCFATSSRSRSTSDSDLLR